MRWAIDSPAIAVKMSINMANISRAVAFRALNARHADEAHAKLAYVVKKINKDGAVSRAPMTASDWSLNAFATHEAAVARVAALCALNPNMTFVVVTL